MKAKCTVRVCKLLTRWELFILILLKIVLAALVIRHMNSTAKLIEHEEKTEENMCRNSDLTFFPNGTVDFRGFNNVSGYQSGCYVVPDIVHLIKFNQAEFTFIELICIASVLTNHKPKVLNIHTNVLEFQGRYWIALQSLPEFSRVRIVYLSQPRSIFGRKFGRFVNWHSSDVSRLQLLQKHGGIYLDSDVYVTSSLHAFRRFEFVVEWNARMYLGNQVLMAHKDARLLPLWLETYKQYNASEWYYNGGVLPTKAVLSHKPELFHRVRDKFGTAVDMLTCLYDLKDWDWKDYPAIHLFINHQEFDFNENSTLQFRDSPIRQMILEVLPDFLYPTLVDISEV